MDILWSPWRSKYIEGFKEEKEGNPPQCFFCEAAPTPERDKEMLVVARSQFCFAILNRYPYNNGHLMIAPYRHVGEFDALIEEEMLDMMRMVKKATKIMQGVYNPDGFNVGINIGRVAGAGVPGHIHIHVVPRWSGDTNFISVVCDTKVISQAIDDTQEILSKEFKKECR